MITTEQLTSLRADTPGCGHKIHLNNAGASLPTKAVLTAMQEYLIQEAILGGYETAAQHTADFKGFYASMAQLLHAQPRNIAWAGSATEAFAKALSAIPFVKGDVLLTTDDDYVSNQIAFLFLRKRFGVKVLRAAKLPEGGVDPQSIKELMDQHNPRLVAVTHVPTNSGLVQDVEAIGQLCRQREVWYLVDACQSAGQMPLDVAAIGCDFLSGTFRKFMRGPRGAGFLFASDRVLEAGLEPIFPDMMAGVWTDKDEYQLNETAHRFEYWEKPFALMMGAKTAVDYALDLGLDNIEARVTMLADYTRELLETLPGVRVLDLGKRRCGIVTAAFDAHSLADIKEVLETAGINASYGQRFNAVIDFDEKGVQWALRVAPHYYNTKPEIDKMIAVLEHELTATKVLF